MEIEDGSTNGTWVNGRRLARGERLRLQDGDTVVLSEGELAPIGPIGSLRVVQVRRASAWTWSAARPGRSAVGKPFEAPKKLRKLSLLACEEGCSKAMDQELEASRWGA